MSSLVRLTKLSSNKNALRDTCIEGTALCLPVVGERFDLYAESRDFVGGLRLISTSPVSSFDGDVFVTRSGTVYRLELLPAAKESA